MIPGAFITAWREHAPWQLDNQVEQDLIISRLLVEIFNHPGLKESLAFRGGTALHKLYFHPATRYSTDIDLVQVKSEPIGQTFDLLRAVIKPILGAEQSTDTGERIAVMRFQYESEDSPRISMRLKLEINTREHVAFRGWQEHEYSMSNPWFSGKTVITTYTLKELLATKMRALYQCRKGRDLFDLWLAQKLATPDPEIVVSCLKKYLARSNQKISRSDYENNLREKLEDVNFTQDVQSLMLPGTGYGPEVAAEWVLGTLVSLL